MVGNCGGSEFTRRVDRESAKRMDAMDSLHWCRPDSFSSFWRTRPRVTPMGLDKSSDTSEYTRHGRGSLAERHEPSGSLYWRRPDTILRFRRIRPSCGGAVHGGRLRRVRLHLTCVWRICKADGCGWLAPLGATGLVFVFLANKAACGAHGARQIERHVQVYPTRSCQDSKAQRVG